MPRDTRQKKRATVWNRYNQHPEKVKLIYLVVRPVLKSALDWNSLPVIVTVNGELKRTVFSSVFDPARQIG